jgi:hypothetical protein
MASRSLRRSVRLDTPGATWNVPGRGFYGIGNFAKPGSSRKMKRSAVFCCAVAMLAGSMPAEAQVVTLNCSFKIYQEGKLVSGGTTQFKLDYGHRTVADRPASFLSDRVVWDDFDPGGVNGTTTYYRRDGGYHDLYRTPDKVLFERYGTCR